MNNINGFSNSLPSTTQFSASDSAKQHDPAASNAKSNAFGDVLTGLTQQGDQQPALSRSPNNNAWRALAGDRFSSSSKDSNPGAPFNADTSGGEVTSDEKAVSARALSKNPLQLPLSIGKGGDSDSLSHDARTGASASEGANDAATLTRTLSGRITAGEMEPSVSQQTDEEDHAPPTSGSAKPANKAPVGPAAKSSAQSAAAPQPGAKTAARVQAPKLPAEQLQQASTASADADASEQLISPGSVIAANMGRHTASSSSQNTERRRRAESESDQTSAAPSAGAQQLAGTAMGLSIVTPAMPFAASGSSSQAPTDSTHGSSGAHADPAKAILSALETEPTPKQEAHEELGAPIKLDSISQTTHFAPVVSLSPTQQVVDAVTTAFPSGSTSTATPAASTNGLSATARPSSSSLKTLDLKLDPQDLGSVSIKLNLSATGLTVEVQASQATTADLIEKDKHALTDGLNNAGYTVSDVAISFAPASGSASGFHDQGLAQNSSGQNWGSDSPGNGGSQTQSGANDSFSRQNPNQGGHGNPETARSAAQRSAGSGLYI